MVTRPFQWIRRPEPLPATLHARIRHRQALQPCRATARLDGSVEITFVEPQRAAVAGQFAVLYDGEECLGGGRIARA